MKKQVDFENLSDLEKSILKNVNKVGGHLLDTEVIALFRLAHSLPDNAKILEVGSYRGKSANAMGYAITKTNKILYCMDIWRDYDTQPTGPLQTDKLAHQIQKSDIAVINDFF